MARTSTTFAVIETSELRNETSIVEGGVRGLSDFLKGRAADLRNAGYMLRGSARSGSYEGRKSRSGRWTLLLKWSEQDGSAPAASTAAPTKKSSATKETDKAKGGSKPTTGDECTGKALAAAPMVPNGSRTTHKPVPVPPEFHSAQWMELEAVAPHCSRVLLYGPPGTGKSTLGHSMAAALGVECHSVPMTEETPAAELRGHFVPKGGEFVWMDGPAIRGWDGAGNPKATAEFGGVFLIDEIDHASADVMTLLHTILDDPTVAKLTLPNGTVVKPKPGFRVVATMNGDPGDLPEALRDRFEVEFEVSEPHPQAIMRLPEDLRAAAHGTVALPDETRRISMRTWLAFARLRESVGLNTAARAVFKHRAADVVSSLKIAAAGDE